MADRVPTFPGVLRAARLVCRYLQRTPLYTYPGLDELLGAQTYVKHENHQRIGSFKARGALAAIFALSDEQRARGVATSTTGNHGQGVAYAAALLGVPAQIYAPAGANPEKVAAMRGWGGTVELVDGDLEAARARALATAADRGMKFVDDGGDARLMEGAGTVALEIVEDLPDLNVLIVPLGGGALASGCGTVLKAVKPSTRLIVVQSEGSPATLLSWRGGRVQSGPSDSFAEGLVTGRPEELAVEVLGKVVDDGLLVADAELRAAIRLLLRMTHNLAEGAGAAALAAALRLKDELRGKKVALILSGANLSQEQLRQTLDGPPAASHVAALPKADC
ncbi:MAG: threonine/serine dehydratase [Chloroflexi bacterium]|nr:threonine/serine dehydratase [Chloroflexota bacterium]